MSMFFFITGIILEDN